jgi:hypothetical protein
MRGPATEMHTRSRYVIPNRRTSSPTTRCRDVVEWVITHCPTDAVRGRSLSGRSPPWTLTLRRWPDQVGLDLQACNPSSTYILDPLPYVTVSFGAGQLQQLQRPRHRNDLLRRPPRRMENVPVTLFETKKLSFSGDVLGQPA